MAVWRARSPSGAAGRIEPVLSGAGLPWAVVLVSTAGMGWAAGRV